MSNKPTYAAIVNNATPDSGVSASAPGAKGDQAVALGAASSSVTGAGPSDAPPPYSAPSHPATQQNQPHQTILPPPQHYQRHQQHHPESGLVSQQQQGWVQPPANVAKSRALRRFWGAFFWAWLIWILVGMLIGGGISDVNSAPPHRHGHWDKHGDWHGDSVNVNVDVGASASASASGGDAGAYVFTPTLVQVKERIGGLLPDLASS